MTKLTTLKGQKIRKNQNFKNCCIESLDHIHIVKDNGDIYVDMPSNENREKLHSLLEDETFAENEVVKLKSKLPTISVLGVENFSSKEDFIEIVKKQNPKVKELIEKGSGSDFSIVFAKEPREGDTQSRKKYWQVVARVSDDMRKVLRSSGDKIYVGLLALKVVDRFFVKRCNKCQEFGHYERDCQNEVCCGYCEKKHKSAECKEVEKGDHQHYHCINCKRANKPSEGHSSLWHQCPSFLDQQKKVKKAIPYYSQKNYQL